MSDGPRIPNEEPAGAGRLRSIAWFYLLLIPAATVILIAAFTKGSDLEAERSVAGQYEIAGPGGCLGESFDLVQSGRFGSISSPGEEFGGPVRVRDGALEGTLRCADGTSAELDAVAEEDRIGGELGGRPFTASRAGDVPPLEERSSVRPSDIEGEYELAPSSVCLGSSIGFHGSSTQPEVELSGGAAGEVEYRDGAIEGTVACLDGSSAELTGEATTRELGLELATEGGSERLVATETREFGLTLALFFAAVVTVMVTARIFGQLAVRIGQPRVMGEVVAGIVLGPTVFGALLPELQAAIFAPDLIPVLGVVANLGLIFYMFMVGIELDPNQLRGRVTQALAISNASVIIPLTLGVAVALPVYELVGPDDSFAPFALFMGVAMSITAFPVLARILVERRMLTRPVGATSLAAAAVDDVTAWFLIALATTLAAAGSGSEVVMTIALALAFCLAMAFVARPLLGRVSSAYDEAKRIPTGWLAVIFAGVLLSAYTTEIIGIALIFGAFLMGMIMPRHAELTEDVTRRIEDFVVLLLLPLFFAYTGLKTDIGLIDQPELWLLSGALLAVAIVGKLAGAAVAARVAGFDWRSSAVIGALMNTRGLTELIVLNLALELGVISEVLFAALVMMALATTFMAGPLLRLLDPSNSLGRPVEAELDDAAAETSASFPALTTPDRAILIASQGPAQGFDQLVELGTLLAGAEPRRELILARLVRPTRAAASGVRGGLQTEALLVEEADREAEQLRDRLIEQGLAARSVAYVSTDAQGDLLDISRSPSIDLVLLDGRRSVFGTGPGGDAAAVLRESPSDVAVLQSREAAALDLRPAAGPIRVPFGGAEHDWAALELAAWIAAAAGARLEVLGAAGEGEESRVAELLGDASLLVRSYAGIDVEPLVVRPGPTEIAERASGASLLVVGLSQRWSREGLGETRAALAETAAAPVLFVRRGTRTGSLAPAGSMTEFGWSLTRTGPAPG